MSIRVMSRVWDHSSQSGGALLVLLALADFANDDGYCYPAVSTLARKSRLSERQVQYVLKGLVASKEIEVAAGSGAKQAGDGGGFTNRYRVICQELEGCNIVTPNNKRGAVCDNEGCSLTHRGVQWTAPKPSGEPSAEPSLYIKSKRGGEEEAPALTYSETPKAPPKPRKAKDLPTFTTDFQRIWDRYQRQDYGRPYLESKMASLPVSVWNTLLENIDPWLDQWDEDVKNGKQEFIPMLTNFVSKGRYATRPLALTPKRTQNPRFVNSGANGGTSVPERKYRILDTGEEGVDDDPFA